MPLFTSSCLHGDSRSSKRTSNRSRRVGTCTPGQAVVVYTGRSAAVLLQARNAVGRIIGARGNCLALLL